MGYCHPIIPVIAANVHCLVQCSMFGQRSMFIVHCFLTPPPLDEAPSLECVHICHRGVVKAGIINSRKEVSDRL